MLDRLVVEAEARAPGLERHDEQTALWYSDWNDRVAECVSADRNARRAFVAIELEEHGGPRSVERKLALLRSLISP